MKHPILIELIERYPVLSDCVEDVVNAYELLSQCYEKDGIVYLCGNGGSASDAEHIVGELMKSFYTLRPVPKNLLSGLDDKLSKNLEGALRAVALTGHPSLSTAFANDVAPDMVFAQQVFGYGRRVDILWGLSTSGNSSNVLHALKVAQARGISTIGMTGNSGGEMHSLCDVCIRVPETEVYKVQELHLPIYHALCRMLETHFFNSPGN